MKNIFILILFLLCSSINAYAARSAISSTDTPNQAWTKQNSMNLETYRKTTPTESGFTGMDAAVIASGTIDDARIPSGIARDSEIVPSTITPDTTDTTKAAAAVISDSSEYATAAGSADSVPATGITGTLSDTQIPSGVARDDEVTSAIESALEGFDGGGSTIAPAETDNTKAAIAVEAESVSGSGIVQDETHRLVSDTEKSAWSAKQDALGYTPESAGNKATDLTSNDTTHYPTTSAVVTGLSDKVDNSDLANASVSHANTAASVDPVKTSGTPGMMSVFEADGTSTLKTGFIGPANSTVNFVYQFPNGIPSPGDTLVTGTALTGQTLPDGSTGTIIPLTHAAGGSGSGVPDGTSTDDILSWDGDSWEPTALSSHPEFASLLAAFSAAGLNSFTFTPSVTYPIWAATSPVTVTFDITDTSTTYAVADVDYQYDGTGGFVENMTNTTGDTWTADVTIATDGAHTIQLEAVDDKSTPNSGQSAVYTINFDGTDPVVGTITPDPVTHAGTGTAVELTIASIIEANEASRQYRVYDVTDDAVEAAYTTFTGLTINVTLPADQHTYRIDVLVTDLAGNTGSASSANIVYEAGGGIGSLEVYIVGSENTGASLSTGDGTLTVSGMTHAVDHNSVADGALLNATGYAQIQTSGNIDYAVGKISFWIYPTATQTANQYRYIFSDATDYHTFCMVHETDNRLRFRTTSGSAYFSAATSTDLLTQNNWHFVEVTWSDVTDQVVLTIDSGTPNTQSLSFTGATEGTNFRLFSSSNGGNDGYQARFDTISIFSTTTEQ